MMSVQQNLVVYVAYKELKPILPTVNTLTDAPVYFTYKELKLVVLNDSYC